MTDADSQGRNAETPIEIPSQGWRGIALRVKDQFGEDHVTLTAAGVVVRVVEHELAQRPEVSLDRVRP